MGSGNMVMDGLKGLSGIGIGMFIRGMDGGEYRGGNRKGVRGGRGGGAPAHTYVGSISKSHSLKIRIIISFFIIRINTNYLIYQTIYIVGSF